MYKLKIRDERGVAMVAEVVLVALVLSFVGLAVWQANQHANKATPTAAVEAKNAAVATDATVEAAAKVVEADSNSDISISAESEEIQDEEFTSVAKDATNLGGSFDDTDL